MLLQSPTSMAYVPFVAVTTDAVGRATVPIMFGTLAGTGRIAISVPTLAVSDTARYTILPGNGARVAVLPADTAVFAGRTFTLRGAVVDRFANVRSEPVTYTASPGIGVSDAGVVTAATLGRYTLQASAAGLAAPTTVSVSVVPQGTLTATRRGGTYRIVRVDLDGSNYRELATASDGVVGPVPDPKWIPGTNTIVYSSYTGTREVLQTVDENGVVAPFITNPPPTMSNQGMPSPARSAPVLYFGAYDSRCTSGAYCLHRSAVDGSSPELLGSFPQNYVSYGLSSSPDGSKVAFSSGQVRVFDYGSKTVSPWSFLGHRPSWSPDGTMIASVIDFAGNVRVANADGTNVRTINTGPGLYEDAAMSWSADSRWLLAKRLFGSLELIEVSTRMVLPLSFTSGYVAGSLK